MDIISTKLARKNKTGIFTKKELRLSGVSQYRIEKLIANGDLERLSRGIYRLALDHNDNNFSETQFRCATALAGAKSAICLLSALEYYHLTDIISNSTWVMIPYHRKVNSNLLTTLRTRNPHWSVGIVRENGYRITTLERTLIDCLVYSRKVGKKLAIESLKLAIKKKETTLQSLYSMAKQLKVISRIKVILEVLI